MNLPRKLFLALLTGLITFSSFGRVLKIEIARRDTVLNGKSFGRIGPYEWISGTILFGMDPVSIYNARIVDLERAPVNDSGLVEATANFEVLQPLNPLKRKGVGLIEVSNRGGKFSLRYFNRSTLRDLDPERTGSFGDGLLMRKGLTVIWVGWQFDVPPLPGMLRLEVPVAKKPDGSSITGLVRSDWTLDKATKVLKLGHHAQIGYAVADMQSPLNILTVRNGRDAPREIVPRSVWQFAIVKNGKVISDKYHIYSKNGFKEGFIYELVYLSKDPPVVGLGLAVIRDIASYAKYDKTAIFPVRQAVAAGVSQTGRFLRHYIYQGFNTDEQGRKVYDGMMIITAGAGRGSFNHRFAQPSRDAHRYSAFFYPTDIFPFSSVGQTDPETGITDGLYSHQIVPNQLPKVYYINTGYEYWGRSAALIHTSVDGKKDLTLLPHERIFVLSSGQHFVGRFPPAKKDAMVSNRIYRGNPLDFSVNYRALLGSLISWVSEGKLPQISVCPRIKNGDLVPVKQENFPDIPGVEFPKHNQVPYRMDYGPEWNRGIILFQPPKNRDTFPCLVPRLDTNGNDLGGIRNVEITVPLVTYFPWNVRTGFKGGSHELIDFLGTFIPFPRTEKEKQKWHDPRPAILTLYADKSDYLEKTAGAADTLIEQGFVLKEDKDYVLKKAGEKWDWIFSR